MSVATNRYCKEHPDLVELCTSCIHEECPRGRCKQYRQMAERIKKESEERQKMADAEGSGTPEVLIKITAAIKALDDLAADEEFQKVYSPLKTLRFRDALCEARNNAYGHLIDWKQIAKRMEKE